MVSENIKLIAENKKPVETVYELKNEYKVPSFEEFMKTYEPSEEVEILTEAEYQDRLLHGSQYGPGNEQSKQTAASVGIGAGLVITTIICPPLGGAMTTAYAGTGLGMKVVGEITENEELAKAGEVLGAGAVIGSMGGGLASSGHACAGCKTSVGKEIWKIRK